MFDKFNFRHLAFKLVSCSKMQAYLLKRQKQAKITLIILCNKHVLDMYKSVNVIN